MVTKMVDQQQTSNVPVINHEHFYLLLLLLFSKCMHKKALMKLGLSLLFFNQNGFMPTLK